MAGHIVAECSELQEERCTHFNGNIVLGDVKHGVLPRWTTNQMSGFLYEQRVLELEEDEDGTDDDEGDHG